MKMTTRCASGWPPPRRCPVSSALPWAELPFWDPVVAWKEKKSSREDAVNEISRRFREWIDIFEKAHKK